MMVLYLLLMNEPMAKKGRPINKKFLKTGIGYSIFKKGKI